MKILFAILALVLSINVCWADIYIRDDGGNTTECDGTVNAAKNSTKKCALNSFYKEMKFTTSAADNIIFGKGSFVVSIQPPSLWITMEQFTAKPEYYVREVKKGRKVYFSKIDGVAYELMLRKY